ncbi:MAG TPA: hypothetical protein VFN01_02725 [Marinobacter sp.]|uniref:hypothetical protein n=1 Tax=Marinobacter sp. TaxID=50741 RepID=UPI002D7F1581|nr:hypothetical protein [Marinobacter sp.]HET8800076.1 hypothetical protein [Marinobacter sp.]
MKSKTSAKLGIVIPLKSKLVSKNWEVTCENLKTTLLSVEAQSCQNFRCVVVGHELPNFFSEINLSSEFFKFNELSPPIIGEDESDNQIKYETDRCTKILSGIKNINENYHDISHWFALDADDLIHRDFVKIFHKYKDYDGIVLDRGYFYFKNTGIVNKENCFSAYCGSSSIISSKLFSIPQKITKESFREIPFGKVSHVNMKKYLEKNNYNVAIPDEFLVMYVRDNGENISNAAYCNTWDRKLKKIIKMIIRMNINSFKIKREFISYY